MNPIYSNTRSGTIGGTLVSIVFNLDAGDLLRTCLLAGVGAIVSFTISLLLKWLTKTLAKRK